MNKEIFKKEIGKLIKLFPEKQIEPSIYFAMLSDIPDTIFVQAVKKLIKTQTEINKSTNLIALIIKYAKDQNKINTAEAWQEVLTHIQTKGCQALPNFSNKLITKAVNSIGGMHAIGMCSYQELDWKRKSFCSVLQELQEKNDDNFSIENKKVLKIGQDIGKIES